MLAAISNLQAADKAPNIVLILADNLGVGMLGCYGQQVITTPNIDRLAQQGIKFNNYYTSVFCAPSRWSLMTGMHDGRIGGMRILGAAEPQPKIFNTGPTALKVAKDREGFGIRDAGNTLSST